MKIIGLCDKETAVALRFMGIHEVYIPDEKIIPTWLEISKKKDVGLILITEEIAEKIGKQFEEYRLRNNIPLILEIPDKKGRRKEHEDYISHLIKRAVGIEVRRGK